MSTINRRSFMKQSALSGASVALTWEDSSATPIILTESKAERSTAAGELVFRPYFIPPGPKPRGFEGSYVTDSNWNAFYTGIAADAQGVRIFDTKGKKKFGINVRWDVEPFGYLYLTADRGGEFYELPPAGRSTTLNMNFELAESRVARNRKRVNLFQQQGWKPSRETQALTDLSEGYLEDARKALPDNESCAQLAQKSLLYALWASEKMELEKAQFDIRRRGYRPAFFFGCDARAYFQMNVQLFLSRFTELFNYATITHYLEGGFIDDFEPTPGQERFALRTALFNDLRARNITVEGRPILYFYRTTTPEWLKQMKYSELLKFVEKHARSLVSHYGDGMHAWEVVNELHDWSNECQLNHEQTIEVTRLACEVARDTNPKVLRLINNCCLFGDYVQRRKWGELEAKYPQRTPFQFVRQLIEAGVDFNITGIQLYFPDRDLADIALIVEKFASLGKPMYVTEIGVSSGPTKLSVESGRLEMPTGLYAWHRPWDENLQAEWMEDLYTLAYSKPYIHAISWYDFVDPYSWVPNGGLLASADGTRKEAFHRLAKLQEQWKRLPGWGKN
jgi:endo-1,4-beta-xylanase